MFIIIYGFFAGLIFGSFANVLIYRLPLEGSVVRPRSHCPGCKRSIRWYDNIPVLSYFLLGGKCRYCRKGIPLQYPAVELIMGTGFALILTFLPWGMDTAAFMVLFFSSVAVAFIDFRWRIIPDEINLFLFVFGLFYGLLYGGLRGILFSLSGAVAGAAFFLLTAWLGEVLFRRESLGGGDVKLLGALGAYVGPLRLFNVVFLASVLGLVYALSRRIFTEYKKKDLAFGPFIILAGMIEFLFRPALYTLLLR